MEAIVSPSIDEEGRRPIYPTFDARLEIADHLPEQLFMFTAILEYLCIQVYFFRKLRQPAPVEIFLVFKYDVVHMPELPLQSSSFGSHGGI
jgi:hypothetical protein